MSFEKWSLVNDAISKEAYFKNVFVKHVSNSALKLD